MTHQMPADLRALVVQVVRDVVADLTPHANITPSHAGPAAHSVAPGARPSGPLNAATRSRSEIVRISGNTDLQSFAYRLLDLFESPKNREDVRTGRLKFELAGGVVAAAAPGAVERIEQGAVTERKVAAAASSGTRLILGRRAVLTPLAREKARTLGVPVEKER